MNLTFPKDFTLGVATSSHQIEGALDEDGRGPSIWDRFAATPGKIADGTDAALACDHYHRMPEDVALMRELGVDGYRFSVAWSRVVPDGDGAVNEAGLDFYERLVDRLLAVGIEPALTLYHWDLPLALEDRGGWRARPTAEAFVRYGEIVARRLGDRVKRWITHNEAWCIATLGHELGEHAPGDKDPAAAIAVRHHLLLSHGWVVPVLRAHSPGAEIGITHNLQPVVPASPSAADRDLARRIDGAFNRWLMDPLVGRGYPEDIVADHVAAGHLPPDGRQPWVLPGDMAAMVQPLDFLGLNYYSRVVARDEAAADNLPRTIPAAPPEAKTDMGWEVYPPGLIELLLRVQRDWPQRKILITECGAAWPEGPDDAGRVRDERRVDFLRDHLAACLVAIDRGIPLAGFYAWSLFDNFEWAFGLAKRFGIVWVDFATQRRILKDSALFYRDVLRKRALAPEDLRAFPREGGGATP
ncbi:MAG: beta-glucosidase [Deltaproteobacteria bacterium]|nr:beta-glucosidase [Deltaproteobacteria bacterium]